MTTLALPYSIVATWTGQDDGLEAAPFTVLPPPPSAGLNNYE